MFSNRVVLVPLTDVVIERDKRQRTNIPPESVMQLAESIANSQWIAPILIDQDTNLLVAGERRYTAVSLLQAAVNGDYSAFANVAAAKATLFPIQSCSIESWQNWTKIPAQLGRDFTSLDLLSYEFIENHQRQDLSWQDKARAIYGIHAEGFKVEGGAWNNAKTSKVTGLDHSTVSKYLKIWRPMEADPIAEIKLIIRESLTLNAALQALARYTSRRQDHVVSLAKPAVVAEGLSELSLSTPSPTPIKKPGPLPGATHTEAESQALDEDDWDEIAQELTFAETVLLNADAHEWSESYVGKPFNFLHCDFPYGIDFNTGPQGRTVDAQLTNDYDDSAELYWSLLQTLATQRKQLIAESAHIMFWYSQNLEVETEAFLIKEFPDATLQRFKMIWHCSDGSGIVPDSQRYGRRTYETAMLLTFGDRKIVAPKALSFAAPRGTGSRIHRSQKPVQVLHHFMSMFVDDASSVLDLTAGSGTSLLVAHQLGARRITGLEISKEAYKDAVQFINARQETVSL